MLLQLLLLLLRVSSLAAPATVTPGSTLAGVLTSCFCMFVLLLLLLQICSLEAPVPVTPGLRGSMVWPGLPGCDAQASDA